MHPQHMQVLSVLSFFPLFTAKAENDGTCNESTAIWAERTTNLQNLLDFVQVDLVFFYQLLGSESRENQLYYRTARVKGLLASVLSFSVSTAYRGCSRLLHLRYTTLQPFQRQHWGGVHICGSPPPPKWLDPEHKHTHHTHKCTWSLYSKELRTGTTATSLCKPLKHSWYAKRAGNNFSARNPLHGHGI